MGKRIAIVAGEASGDMLGAALVSAVRERFPGTEFYGIAGPKMIAAGANRIGASASVAIVTGGTGKGGY